MELSLNEHAIIAAVVREHSTTEEFLSILFGEDRLLGVLSSFNEVGVGKKARVDALKVQISSQEQAQQVIKSKDSISIQIQAVDSIYTFGTELLSFEKGFINLKVIGPLKTTDRRKKNRSELVDDFESPILIESSGKTVQAMLTIKDYSYRALGVEIRSLIDINALPEPKVYGTINVNSHLIQIENGKLRRLKQIVSESREKTILYSAGLIFPEEVKTKDRSERLSQRVEAESLKIGINSCLSPSFEIKISLIDIAISGFKAKILKPQDKLLLWQGCGVSLHNSDLKGTIISEDNESIRVEWFLGDSDGERQWQELVSSTRNPYSDLTLSNAEGLMTAFIRSGSAAKEYINQIPLIGSNTTKGLSKEQDYPDWFFKWLERDQNGRIKGHIAGYQLADNLWCAGDLFADPDQNYKLSLEFAKKFLEHFVDFLQRRSPVPKIYAAWAINHPFWKNTDEYIKNNPDILFSDLIGETFFPNSKELLEAPKSEVVEIRPFDFKLIDSISETLKINGTLAFVKSFDFDQDRFGSPKTRAMFSYKDFLFRRRYFKVNFLDFSFLSIITKIPYGVSPYNNTSIIYSFILNGDEQKFDQMAANAIAIQALKCGVFPHRVVFVTKNDTTGSNSKLKVRTVIAQPKMWLNT